MNDSQKKDRDKLADALRGAEPDALRDVLAKTETINFRVTASDKVEMQETAKALALTLSEYLTRLHVFAVGALAKHSKKGGR